MTKPEVGSKRNWWLPLLVSLGVALLLGEGALRLAADQLNYSANFLFEMYSESWHPLRYDAQVGWVPGPPETPPGVPMHSQIIPLGDFWVRSNGHPLFTAKVASRHPRILATGCSFTYGDQVADNQSWPADLERKMGVPVVNGGAVGYGVDQTFLRTQEILRKEPFDLVLFSFILNSVSYTEYSQKFGHYKPYFRLENGRLAIQGVPPSKVNWIKPRLDPLRRLLGHSLLAHRLFLHFFPKWWQSPALPPEKHENVDGTKVACHLFDELVQLQSRSRTRIVVVVQYGDNFANDYRPTQDFLSCVNRRQLTVVDAGPTLERIRTQDPARFRRLYNWHMTAEGNELMTEIIQKGIGHLDSSERALSE